MVFSDLLCYSIYPIDPNSKSIRKQRLQDMTASEFQCHLKSKIENYFQTKKNWVHRKSNRECLLTCINIWTFSKCNLFLSRVITYDWAFDLLFNQFQFIRCTFFLVFNLIQRLDSETKNAERKIIFPLRAFEILIHVKMRNEWAYKYVMSFHLFCCVFFFFRWRFSIAVSTNYYTYT